MRLVLDASMALAWLFERQSPDDVKLAEHALVALPNAEVRVPALWHTEVANALLVAERRQVVSEARVFDYLSKLSALPIDTDDLPPVGRRDAVMALAREHGLTAYDATYLELALRLNAVLATFDRKLVSAMYAAGGVVFGDAPAST